VKRRGFLGFLAGGAVAAPAMAQHAVNSIGQASIGIPIDAGVLGFASQAAGSGYSNVKEAYDTFSPQDHARASLLKLVGKSAELIAYEKRQQSVYQVDADIAAMRSLAMHAKVRMQRERNWQAQQNSQKDYLSRVIDGWFEKHSPPDPTDRPW
jgi:hypothetical protein